MSLHKKTKQKFVLSFLAVFILMQLFTISFLGTSHFSVVQAWDGSSFLTPQGLGIESSPYIIESAEHLKWVSVENNAGNFPANTYFKLSASIDLENYNWVPIGTSEHPFEGQFDGDSNSVYRLNLKDENTLYKYSGLFGYISGAVIENLKVIQVDFLLNLQTEEEVYVGSVAGYITGSTIRQVMNGGTIQLQNANNVVYAGGIVGYADLLSTVTQVVNHIVISTLSVEDAYIGGLIGYVSGSTVSSSYNKQIINITTTNSAYVGGLIGQVNESNLQKVFNDGAVTVKSNQIFVGGIAGVVSNAGSTSYNQKLMYNTKKITISPQLLDEENLFIGGLFGQVQANNIIGYAYNSAEVAKDIIGGVNTTVKIGSLVGSLAIDATLQYSYFNRAYNVGTVSGVGEALGNIVVAASAASDLSITQMRSSANYVGPSTNNEWKFNTTGAWLITGNINGGLPTMRYVGNYAVHAQSSGGGTISPKTNAFYNSGETKEFTLTANKGYQIQKIILNNQEYTTPYRGKTSATFNVTNDGIPTSQVNNLAVMYEPIPFVKTQMFYYIVGVGSLIIIMIVGTIIINYRYAVKMDKLMDKNKKTLHLEPEKEPKKGKK